MADDVDRLASAVAHRFSASQEAARLASARTSRLASAQLTPALARPAAPTLMDRLASAVGQRLAIGSQLPSIEPLASAVAKRLSASKGAARLASAATRHYALDSADKTASAALVKMNPALKA